MAENKWNAKYQYAEPSRQWQPPPPHPAMYQPMQSSYRSPYTQNPQIHPQSHPQSMNYNIHSYPNMYPTHPTHPHPHSAQMQMSPQRNPNYHQNRYTAPPIPLQQSYPPQSYPHNPPMNPRNTNQYSSMPPPEHKSNDNSDQDLNDGFPEDFDVKRHKLKANNGAAQQHGSVDDYVIEQLMAIARKRKHLPVYDCIGQLLMHFGGLDQNGNKDMTGGTGIVFRILSNHHYLVLTAAHNLQQFNKISKTREDPLDVWYFPRGSSELKCRLQFVDKVIYDEYTPERDLCPGDLAVVLFHDKKGGNGLGAAHYDNIAVNNIIEVNEWPEDADPTVHVFGYPIKTHGLLQGQAGEAELETNRGLWIYEDIFTYPGESGAPIFKKIRKQKKYGIYGVHTFGDTTKQENCGIFLDSRKREWIKKTMVKFEAIARANAPKDAMPQKELKDKVIMSVKAEEWLREMVGLKAVIDVLIDEGYDNMVALQSLEEDDLKEMKIKKGHRKQIMHHVQRLRKQLPIKDIKKPSTSDGSSGYAFDNDDDGKRQDTKKFKRKRKKHGRKEVNLIDCKLKDFIVLEMLSVGSLSRMSLVEDPKSGLTYALKKVRKNKVIETGQQEHVRNERAVGATLDSDFCVKLFGTYQDKFNIYLLMEPVLGGELFTVLRWNTRFSEKTARFYAGCTVLAFEALHSKDIIYRDLKPENLLIAKNGYCKLTDFGFAKKRNNSCTLCGTPDYLSPEVIQNYSQDCTVDWWALGIFVYEMVVGHVPFQDDPNVKMYEKILTYELEFGDDPKLSPKVQHLISGLLEKNALQRLGAGRNGTLQILNHPWFHGLNWDDMRVQKVAPPYVPNLHISDLHVECGNEYPEEDIEEKLDPDPSVYEWCEDF